MNSRATTAPLPLLVAVVIAAAQGLFLLGYAVLEIVNTGANRWAMGASTAAFFALYGAGLLVCAWALRKGDSWARSPVVLTQLIAFGVAWSFRGEGTQGVAATLFAIGVIALVAILNRRSLAYLAEEDPRGTPDL